MKKLMAVLLTATMTVSALAGGYVKPVKAAQDDASKYVELQGDWNFKLYRKYSTMFQYGAGSRVVWEDLTVAGLPNKATWSTWEKVGMPSDNIATGGLLDIDRAVEEQPQALSLEAPESETEETLESVQQTDSNTAESESGETETPETIETEETSAETTAETGESESTEESTDESQSGESESQQATIAARSFDLRTADPFDPNAVFFPMWSEAWLCRSFTLPADFSDDEYVTLLLGIVDDIDVVYINGQLVAASGFKDGNGNPTMKIPANGGFNYGAANAEDKVQFEKSYWEIERSYKIPKSCLNLGGENEICIRVYNNNGNGGFYTNHAYAICGNDLAVRAAKGLPTDKVDAADIQSVIDAQIAAIEAGDIDAYAETVYKDYKNDGLTKADRVAEIKAYIDGYSDLEVKDENAGIYKDSAGNYVYSAKRTITGVAKELARTSDRKTVFSGEINIYYASVSDKIYEYGNWSRCYSVTYDSGLFNQKLSYGIYLPPSYYNNPDRKYPVVYLLHGINSTNNSFMSVDHIDTFMDNQIAAGNITEMIVVMPNSGKNSFYKDTPYDKGNHDSTGPWKTHITSEIRKEIDDNYRTLNDAKFRGLTGISMGGGGAVSIGTTTPEFYSSIASHMGALGGAVDYLKAMSKEQIDKFDFYVDCGLQDKMVNYKDTVAVHEYLDSIGKAHGYDLREGGHNSAFYMAGMPASVKMHSDHFLKNGLFDASLGLTQAVFDKNTKSDKYADVHIPVTLNGNVVTGISGLNADDYTVGDNEIVLSKSFLSGLTEDTKFTVSLYSGKTLSFNVKITDTTNSGQESETKETSQSDTEKQTTDTKSPNKPNNPDAPKTGDDFNLKGTVLMMVCSMIVICAGGVFAVFSVKKKRSNKN